MPKSHEKNAAPSETNGTQAGGPEHRSAPGVVAPSNRVNVAFPFASIKLQEPSQELADLAGLLFDLIVAMAEWVPEDQLEELRTRAQALHERLR